LFLSKFKHFKRKAYIIKKTKKGMSFRSIMTTLPPGEYHEFYFSPNLSIYTQDSEILSFLKRPYLILPFKRNKFLLIIPKWFSPSIGRFLSSVGSYNIFHFDSSHLWTQIASDDSYRELISEIKIETKRLHERLKKLIGLFLSKSGFDVKYEYRMGIARPDIYAKDPLTGQTFWIEIGITEKPLRKLREGRLFTFEKQFGIKPQTLIDLIENLRVNLDSFSSALESMLSSFKKQTKLMDES